MIISFAILIILEKLIPCIVSSRNEIIKSRRKGTSGDDKRRGDDIVTKFPPGRSWKIGGYG